MGVRGGLRWLKGGIFWYLTSKQLKALGKQKINFGSGFLGAFEINKFLAAVWGKNHQNWNSRSKLVCTGVHTTQKCAFILQREESKMISHLLATDYNCSDYLQKYSAVATKNYWLFLAHVLWIQRARWANPCFSSQQKCQGTNIGYLYQNFC